MWKRTKATLKITKLIKIWKKKRKTYTIYSKLIIPWIAQKNMTHEMKTKQQNRYRRASWPVSAYIKTSFFYRNDNTEKELSTLRNSNGTISSWNARSYEYFTAYERVAGCCGAPKGTGGHTGGQWAIRVASCLSEMRRRRGKKGNV